MGWQRKIPFGYQIKGGQPAASPTEAEAVREIFAQYQAGVSYVKIAMSMEKQEIPYHQHTPHWNKNMVKRILENDVYLGGKMYPRLISNEDFLAVRLQRDEKNLYKPCSADVDAIRTKLVCVSCGQKLRRGMKRKGIVPWHCPNCGKNHYASDASLRDTVKKQLMEMAETPEMLVPPESSIEARDLGAIRIENELTLCFNRGDTNPDYMKTLIFASAAERYAALPDPTRGRTMEQLRRRLADRPVEEADLWELLECFVKAVRIGKKGKTELELINGMIIGREERSE